VGARLVRVVPHAVMLAVACWLYWVASRIDVETGGRISPAVWPRAILVFMGLLCVYEIVKRLVVGTDFAAKGLLAGSEMPAGEQPAGPPENHKMLFSGIAAVAGYVVAVPWLGFFPATALFLAVFPWLGGQRRPLVLLTVSLAGTLVLALVFLRVAYISLPLGEGPFRQLSLALLRLIGVT
jgi:putative tricarboxylic transport membrane protein